MLTLRCTGKLLTRLKVSAAGLGGPASSTALGDWYATFLILERQHLILFVAEKTLLPVLVRASPASSLVPRFRFATREVLLALGVGRSRVDLEIAAMEPVRFDKTQNPPLLGSMNDFIRMLRAGALKPTLLGSSLELAQAPCGPLQMESPDRATRALFAPQ
jgi:hypothetical protein